MKNKKNLYLLVPAVLIIWGLVIYKFISGVNPDAPVVNQTTTVDNFKPKEIKESASFTVKLDYRDPFLGTFDKKKKPVKKRVVKSQPKKPEVPFPKIVYKGLVSPKGKSEKVFLISINGQQQLFKLKNTFNEVTLLRGNEKEITLKFQKEKRTFQLQK